MRVGINTLFFVPGDVGGTEVYLRQNLISMALHSQEQVFVLFTSRDNDATLRGDLSGYTNISFRRLPFRSAFRPIRIILEQVLLPWFTKKNKIDVLWSPGYTAPIGCSCPQVVTVHDLQYKTHPEDLSFSERVTLDFLVRTACRTSEAIITVSQFSKNELIRFKFASKNKISVVYEGVDSRFGEPPDPMAPCPIDLSTKTPYILCVANTYPHKNVHVLVKAFDLIADRVPHHLILVGKARRGEIRLKQSLSASANKARIHRLKNLSFETLCAVYHHANIFVLPSEYEGFGLPILEAMAAGIPVITTRNASLPEVGNVYVSYVKNENPESFAEEIVRLSSLDDKEKHDRVENARNWSKTFGWRKSAEQTLKILKNLSYSEQVFH